ncbi:MAG: FAD-dependent oxidoreductase [Pseudomonadota bacterium]
MTFINPVLTRRSRIAVVGAGISGLGAAWALKDVHDVTVFEKEPRLGGHANTVEIDYDGQTVPVDTGFIVYNTLNYKNFTPFLETLGVESFETDMSFGFSLAGDVEWSSNGLGGVLAQPRNLTRPSFLSMLRDVLRFNKSALRDLESGALEGLTLAQYLDKHGYGRRFRSNYLLPMGAAIWSSTEADMQDYPAEALIRFFKNHRLVNAVRPKWRTVKGGSISYVTKVAAELKAANVVIEGAATSVRRHGEHVIIRTENGLEHVFDEVILACHANEALALLEDADMNETQLLGALPYAPNTAVLHRDPALAPASKGAQAAWCYMSYENEPNAAVTYNMNRLQGIDADKPLYVTLNPVREPDPALTFGRFEYDHPQFTAAGLAAQRIFNSVQGVNRTWFAGAWLGYGFHEDGLRAGLRVALRLGGRIGWDFQDGDISGGAWGERVLSTDAIHVAAE